MDRLRIGLTKRPPQCYRWVMIPEFEPGGNLPRGVHWATWEEFCDRFGATPWRLVLVAGLRAALVDLRRAGCRTAYVDGSFVTSKTAPGDFDACWDPRGVDLDKLDSVLRTFDEGRAAQKAKYGGELFPSVSFAGCKGPTFLDFFQTDRDTGAPKGIVALDLGGLP